MYGVVANTYIRMDIGQPRHVQVTAGWKAAGNTTAGDGYGYPAIGGEKIMGNRLFSR